MANLDLKATLELIDKMSQPLKAISSQASKMQKDIAGSTKELQKMQSTLNKANNLSGLTDKLRQVQQEIKKVANEEKALSQAISASGVPTRAQSRDLAKLSATLAQLQQKQAGYRAKMGELGRGINEAGYSSKNLARTQAELAARMNTATAAISRQRAELARLSTAQKKAQSMKDLGDKMQTGGTKAAMAGAGTLYAMSKPLNEAKKFETETARIGAMGIGDEATKDAVKFAKSMNIAGTSIKDNLVIVKDAVSIMSGDEHHAKIAAPILAKAQFAANTLYGQGNELANEEQTQAAIKTAELRGGLKSAEAFQSQLDFMFKSYASSGGRVKPTDYLDAVKKGGLAVKSMTDEAFYLGAEGPIQELKGSTFGNAAMSMYQNLAQGKVTKKAANKLVDLGLIGDLSKVHYDKVGQTASLDAGAIKGYDLLVSDQAKWVEQVYKPTLAEHGITSEKDIHSMNGTVATNRSAANLLTQYTDQTDALKKKREYNSHAEGIDALYNRASNTAEGKENIAKSKMHDAYLQLGTAILPTYTAAIEAATAAMQGMTAIMEKYPTLTKAIAVGLAAIAAAFVVFGGLAAIVGSVLVPLALLRVAITSLGGVSGMLGSLVTAFNVLRTAIMGISAAAMLNPIGLAIMAIALLAGVLILYWEPIKAFFTGLWQGISAGLAPAVAALKSAFAPLAPILSSLGAAFTSLLSPIHFSADALLSVKAAGFAVGTAIAALVTSIISVGTAMGTFAAMVVTYGGAAISYVGTIPSRMLAFLSGLPAQMSAMGGQIMDGLKNGIMSRASAVIEGISSIAGKIKSAFTGAMAIHSPSRVFASYGDFMMQGLHQGITTNDSPVSAIMRTSDNIRSAMDTSAIRFDSRPPIRSGMAGANAQTSPAPITINVYASAGQSVKEIARQVASELARTGQAQTSNNTALYDLPEQWG